VSARSVALARQDLEAAQLGKLRGLVERCEANPFYAARLEAAGLRGASLGSLVDLRRLEPVDKHDLIEDQEASPPFGTRLGIEASEIREVHLTSGTSGLGQEALALSAGDLDISAATWAPAFAAAGLGPGDLFATFYPVTFFAYGRSVVSGGRAAGVPTISLVGVDRSVALDVLLRLRPRAIGARPALFVLLAEELAARSMTPAGAFPELRSLVASGLSAPQAVELEEAWGAVAHEVYGLSQAMGVVASTGAEGAAPGGIAGVMRCNEGLFLVEAVDPDTLEPVDEGEAELLLTCLDRVASPIIRFRTRDRVEIVPPGSCADASPFVGLRVGRISRWDDMLKIRGNNVWPSQLDEALLGDPGVLDYLATVLRDARQVEQMEIAVRPDVAAGGGTPAHAEALVAKVKRHTNVRPSIRFDPALPEPALKPKRLLDRRAS
jgi:phenylacetate-CoA ligase